MRGANRLRTAFIVGLTAVVAATAAAIGYFVGPYVAKAGKVVMKAMRKMILDKLKTPKCFAAGTLVMTEDGNVPIEKIKVGEYVLSQNPETGEKGYKPVLNVFVNKTNEIIELQAGSEIIETTEGHPFWVSEKGWVEAQNLVIGDTLVLYNNSTLTVDSVKIVQLKSQIKVYNFEVAEWHTYFVAKSSIFVHNANCGNELQQLKEAARQLGIKDQRTLNALSKDLHAWKRVHGMKAGDHMSWKKLLEFIMDFMGM
jgi:hypothetical protein